MDVQRNLEANVEKRTKDMYGPPPGRRLLVFMDDMNMPQVGVHRWIRISDAVLFCDLGKFLPPDAILYLFETAIRPLTEYCCHIWAGASACQLFLLDRVQNCNVSLVGEGLGTALPPLFHQRSVASLCLFYIYIFMVIGNRCVQPCSSYKNV